MCAPVVLLVWRWRLVRGVTCLLCCASFVSRRVVVVVDLGGGSWPARSPEPGLFYLNLSGIGELGEKDSALSTNFGHQTGCGAPKLASTTVCQIPLASAEIAFLCHRVVWNIDCPSDTPSIQTRSRHQSSVRPGNVRRSPAFVIRRCSWTSSLPRPSTFSQLFRTCRC